MKRVFGFFQAIDNATLRWADAAAVWLYDRFGLSKMIVARAFAFGILGCIVQRGSINRMWATLLVCATVLILQLGLEFWSRHVSAENFELFCERNFRYFQRYLTLSFFVYNLFQRDDNYINVTIDGFLGVLYVYTLSAHWPIRPRIRRRQSEPSLGLAATK